MQSENKFKNLIIKSAYTIVIILIITIISLIILKYNIEGEKNMPFKLTSIILVSNAEGYQTEENSEYRWDADILQTNDIYLNIEKNKNYKETEVIKSIVIDNIKITEEPAIGKIKFYRASNKNNNLFSYEEDYEIKDKIEYLGSSQTQLEDLKISNQGCTLLIRAINETGKKITSNEEEFKHNGQLLKKVDVSNEDIKFNVELDISINLESGISFKATVPVQLPVGDILNEGSSNKEIKELKSIVFKRKQG